jgi:molybdopterin-guanine dinucleotide biosynthesis protein A
MGRDKARLVLKGKSLLGHIRSLAKKMGWPVRVIRRDAVRHCGPLGGIYTALKAGSAETHLFLACDMPFVSSDLLARVAARAGSKRRAVFATLDGTAGFPFCLPAAALPVVEAQIRKKQFSLQALARVLEAKLLRIPKRREHELLNINTPEDWLAARRLHEGSTERCRESRRGFQPVPNSPNATCR